MKAILVIDKAESCTSCLLGIYNKKWFCLATNKDIDICDRYNIPTWCPLKPFDYRRGALGSVINHDGYTLSDAVELLDEITGETE